MLTTQEAALLLCVLLPLLIPALHSVHCQAKETDHVNNN